MSLKEFSFNQFFLEACRQKYIGNYEDALNSYMMAYRVDESQAVVCYEMALLLAHLEDFSGSEIYAKKAVDLDYTENEHYKIYLSYIYKINNKNKESIKVVKNLLKRNPNEIKYYLELTSLYVENKEPKKAIAVLNKAEKQFGVYEEFSREKWHIYLSLGEKKKALKEAEMLSETYPTDTKFMAILAEMYIGAEDLKSAQKVYKHLDTMSNKVGIVYLSLAEYNFMSGHYNKAFENAFKGFASDDVDIQTKQNFAFIILNAFTKEMLGDKDEATSNILQMLEVLKNTYPDELKIRMLNAEFLTSVGRYKDAYLEYESILQFEKGDYEVWKRVIHFGISLDEMQKTYEYAKEAVELFPNSIEFYWCYAVSASSIKEYKDAVDAVSAASLLPFESDEEYVGLLSIQGNSYNALKMYHQSDSVYDKILLLDKENLIVLNNYSYFLAVRSEKLEKALQMSKQLVSLNSKESVFLDTHAWVLYKSSKFEEALEYINMALKLKPNNAVYLEHKGDIMFKLGKEIEAVNLWTKALELGEGSDFLKEKVEKKYLIED